MEVVKRDPTVLTSEFQKNLEVASKTEQDVAKIMSKQGLSGIEFNDDNRFDIKGFFSGQPVFIEVKEDFTCKKTGNVGIEFSCLGRPSGVLTTKADIYALVLHLKSGKKVLEIIYTSELKKMIEEKKYKKVVTGGNPKLMAKNYIFSLRAFKERSLRIHTF